MYSGILFSIASKCNISRFLDARYATRISKYLWPGLMRKYVDKMYLFREDLKLQCFVSKDERIFKAAVSCHAVENFNAFCSIRTHPSICMETLAAWRHSLDRFRLFKITYPLILHDVFQIKH